MRSLSVSGAAMIGPVIAAAREPFWALRAGHNDPRATLVRSALANLGDGESERGLGQCLFAAFPPHPETEFSRRWHDKIADLQGINPFHSSASCPN